jgi:hypothetical protein
VAYRSGGGRTLDGRGETRRPRAELIGACLKWKRAGKGWRLFDGKRRFGDVDPDSKHPGMWRVVLSGGRLSDMANLSRARNAVLEAATRELEYEARNRAGIDPRKCPEKGGVFPPTLSHSDSNAPDHDRPPEEGAE